MKRTLALLLALGALLAAAAVAQASSVTYFHGVGGGRVVKPHTLYLSGDGTLGVVQTSWQSWGGPRAIGQGTAHYHGCKPDCAAGKDHAVKVTVRLSDKVTCAGKRYYNRVTLIKRAGGGMLFARDLRLDKWAPCKLP